MKNPASADQGPAVESGARGAPGRFHPQRHRTPGEIAEAERQADVQSGRAFEWQAGQDAYERWLNEIAP